MSTALYMCRGISLTLTKKDFTMKQLIAIIATLAAATVFAADAPKVAPAAKPAAAAPAAKKEAPKKANDKSTAKDTKTEAVKK